MTVTGISSSGWGQYGGLGGISLTGRVARSMVEEQDADQNGSLTQAETKVSKAAFDAIDGNKDGVLTETDLVNGLGDRQDALQGALASAVGGQSQSGSSPGSADLEKLASLALAGLDADGSGSANLAESKLSSESFGKVDGNGDGVITAAETANAIRDNRDEASTFLSAAQGSGTSASAQAVPHPVSWTQDFLTPPSGTPLDSAGAVGAVRG